MYNAEALALYPEDILKSQVMSRMEDPLYRNHAVAFAEATSTKEDDPTQTMGAFIMGDGSMLAIKKMSGADPYDSTEPLSLAVRGTDYVFVSGKMNPATQELEIQDRAITVPPEYTPSYIPPLRDGSWYHEIFEIEGELAALAPDEHPAGIQWLASNFGSSASVNSGFESIQSRVLMGEPNEVGEGNVVGIDIQDSLREIHEAQESDHGIALEAESRAEQVLQAKAALPVGKAILGKLVTPLRGRFQEQYNRERNAAARDAYLASQPGRRRDDA